MLLAAAQPESSGVSLPQPAEWQNIGNEINATSPCAVWIRIQARI